MALPTQTSTAVDTLIKFKRDHWSFLSEAIFTLDQTDKIHPIKRYPFEKEYLKWFSSKIVNETLFAAVKHRRLVATWTLCAVFLWDAMFHEGRFNALLSKKEEDSDELVRRCKFMYEQIPDDVMPLKPLMSYKYTEINFPEINSKIKGFAQGPDQLRQYTCSRIGADEIAFWPDARETFVAMKPTLEGGGRVTLISTRYPGFFQDLVYDRLDA